MKKVLLGVFSALILLVSTTSFAAGALYFSFTPTVALPTTVAQDGTVTASYTVTNILSKTYSNIYVKHLPPNVAQVINAGGNTCGATFTLASKASCVLELTISGAVSRDDPVQDHHLFVCLSDKVSCAGPLYADQLNVTVTPAPSKTLTSIDVIPTTATIAAPLGGVQLTAMGTYSDGSTADITDSVTWASINADVTVSSTGFVTGVTADGTPTVSATLSGKTSNTSTITTNKAFVWAGNDNTALLTHCSVLTTGLLNDCTIDTNITGSNVYNPTAIAQTYVDQKVYLFRANGLGQFSICEENSSGNTKSCSNQTITDASLIKGIAVNDSATFAYIVSSIGKIYTCPLVHSGDNLSLGVCESIDLASLIYASDLYGATIVTLGGTSYLYTLNQSSGRVVDCPIKTADSSLGMCKLNSFFNGSLHSTGIASVVIAGTPYLYVSGDDVSDPEGTYLYNVAYCPISADGAIGNACTGYKFGTTSFNNIAINSSGTYAYLTMAGEIDPVDLFSINASTGELTWVSAMGNDITGPNTIALN